MKLKYTLGALAVVSSLAGCSLDVNMYEGVTGEDVTVTIFPGAVHPPIQSLIFMITAVN